MSRACAVLVALFACAAASAEAQTPPTDAEITRAYLRHKPTGDYQYFGLMPADWRTPYEIDRRGVPIVEYSFGRAYNPVTVAQYGLAQWTIGRNHRDRARIEIAVRMAKWLIRRQDTGSGKWLYRFAYQTPGAGVLPRPWASALAQGQVVSLLRRVYARTGDRRYLASARRALRPLGVPVARGGLLRRWRSLPFFEEYPTTPDPTYVLNGFQQCLLGLYDLSDVSPVARRLFRRGMRTLAEVLPRYDLGSGWSSYSLAHEYWPSPQSPASASYHLSHVGMLRLLDRIRPDPVLRLYARRWLAGL